MYLLYDIGGTKTRIAYSSDGTSFEEPKIFETPQNFKQGIALLAGEGKLLAKGRKIEKVVAGIAGPLDGDREGLIVGPHLKDWGGKPLKMVLGDALGIPVFLENDAALVGLGEAHDGAGKDFPIVAYLTVSTGVGGARIVDGHVDRRSMSFEPGKQIIDPDKSLMPNASGPTLEDYIGGAATEKRTGKKPHEIKDFVFWDRAAYFLALGLNNVVVHWAPDVIVIGGSMMKEVGIPIPLVQTYLKQVCTIFPTLPIIKKATLGDLGGIHGALVYAREVS